MSFERAKKLLYGVVLRRVRRCVLDPEAGRKQAVYEFRGVMRARIIEHDDRMRTRKGLRTRDLPNTKRRSN